MQLGLILWIVQRLWLVLPQGEYVAFVLTVTCSFLKIPFIQEGAVELNAVRWRRPRQLRHQRTARFSFAPPHAFPGALQNTWKGLWYEALDPGISILLTACRTVASISLLHRELLCVARQVPGGCAGSPQEGFKAWQRSVSLDDLNLQCKHDVRQRSRKVAWPKIKGVGCELVFIGQEAAFEW